MKKFLCLFFSVLFLLTLTLPTSAALSFDDLTSLNMDNTSIEYDFDKVFYGDYNLSDYQYNSKKTDLELITMAEKGYNESGINLYGAISKPDINWSGVTISCKDNVFTLDGKTTSKGTVRGVWFTVNNLKPDTVYSVRLTKISGSFIDSEIRFYGFRTIPNVAWRKTHFSFSDASLNECVESFSYSEDEIAQGVGLGLYSCDLSENAEFTDYKVRVDIVEGSYTADTFPEYRPYGSVGADYGQYFYLYNPSQKNIVKDSELNQITLQSNIYKLTDYYDKLNLKLIDTYGATEETETTTNALILKYALLNYDDFSYSETFSSRAYSISEIELLTDGDINATSYPVANDYKFTEMNGYTVSTYEETEVVRIEKENLEFAYYRSPDEGSTDNFHDLHTVFFTVPDNIEEEYGELVKVSAVWEECLTQPILLTNNRDIYKAFKEILGQECPEDFPYAFGYDYKVTHPVRTSSGFVAFYGVFYYLFNDDIDLSNKLVNIDFSKIEHLSADNYYNNLIDKIYFVERSDDVFTDNVIISSVDMIDRLDEYEWSDEVFINIDQSNYDEPVHFDNVFVNNFNTYRNPTFWEKFVGKNNKLVDELPYTNLTKVDSKDLRYETRFCEDYFVSSSEDYEEIKAMYNSVENKNRTDLYALRFTVTPYITHQVYFYDADGKQIETESLVAQATAIRNFDFIDLTYCKDGVYYVLPVQGSPQNTIGDITGNKDYGNTADEWWKEFLELVEKVLRILFVLIVVTIILKVVQIFKRPKVIIKEEGKRKE